MTVYPFILHFGPITITGYGIMMMVGFLVGGWLIGLELKRRTWNQEYAADIVVAAVIGGILGAKLWYVALTQDVDAWSGMVASLEVRSRYCSTGGVFEFPPGGPCNWPLPRLLRHMRWVA
jgi:phosphatidylglycerol:prolipoprotein diacylglycerol transferase